VRDLRKVFHSVEGSVRVAVEGLTLDMWAGRVTALLGHNGAGKTTTIHMLTGEAEHQVSVSCRARAPDLMSGGPSSRCWLLCMALRSQRSTHGPRAALSACQRCAAWSLSPTLLPA
jgi:ABC-type branched-subunit amino acid transport system ATPase component